ncbi:MAG TPA: ABC transporter permease [Pseudoflavonifractor sp.]|nr:ABC transporter permease [Pseudoflavonifractor sp.]
MLKYILKRLLLLIPVVLGITFIIFVVLSMAPGDPAALILGQDATVEALAAKRAEMGLDKPIVIQYVTYMLNMLRGNFGTSWLSGYEVLPEFLHRMPNTIMLGSLAMLFSVIIGIPVGIIAAIRQNHFVDYASLAIALILFSLPSFWFGMMGQILLCLNLGWLPASGVGSLKHFILPAITLGANILASQLRMTRTSMLDVVKQDYIRTARAKGADEKQVVLHHVLQNGMLPIITQIGISFASCMGGSVITETVFSIPGIGSLLINAVKGRDVPVVMGTLVFIAVFVGIVNLIVDIFYALIDPRVKLTA